MTKGNKSKRFIFLWEKYYLFYNNQNETHLFMCVLL